MEERGKREGWRVIWKRRRHTRIHLVKKHTHTRGVVGLWDMHQTHHHTLGSLNASTLILSLNTIPEACILFGVCVCVLCLVYVYG